MELADLKKAYLNFILPTCLKKYPPIAKFYERISKKRETEEYLANITKAARRLLFISEMASDGKMMLNLNQDSSYFK